MSYSIQFRSTSKVEHLRAVIEAAFDRQVMAYQVAHKVDREAAIDNVMRLAEIMGDPPDGEDFVIHMHGSIGGDIDWSTGEVKKLSTMSTGCGVYHSPPSL